MSCVKLEFYTKEEVSALLSIRNTPAASAVMYFFVLLKGEIKKRQNFLKCNIRSSHACRKT